MPRENVVKPLASGKIAPSKRVENTPQGVFAELLNRRRVLENAPAPIFNSISELPSPKAN
jgi:hypothetical protein